MVLQGGRPQNSGNLHPVLGELELYAQRLVDPDEGQELLVFVAEPGTPSAEKLQSLETVTAAP
ncbi:hypothetical protein GCM10009554_14210 [Kribbella koreensis]|uniref:MmyB-like transcription regulator ligand binding domain-containing protein n=2 Tax=Kribbella TaxID=182639 RepID=A0ABP6YMV9_9ACTN